MNGAYVAVDIGASSGRLMLAQITKNNQIQLQEIHRFTNGFKMVAGHERWNIDYLIHEILTGLEKVKKAGFKQVHLGIDTWAVDYVLVDHQGKKLCDPISYRDKRTAHAIADLTSDFSKDYLYEKTGIQFQDFNTLYQLYEEDQALLAKTDKIMMIPDYIGYVLTGQAATEVTNASTTQMLNLRGGLFDKDLLSKINVHDEQFAKLVEAGTYLGPVMTDWMDTFDLPITDVITVATHDTASAVVGTPAVGHDWAFLSSGTWSLLGTELNVPENGRQAFHENYTNEWGAYGTYRFLKNIMGLWVAQCVKHGYQDKYSFSELAAMATKEKPFQQFIDINDERFVNPKDMIAEIQTYCRETHQTVPTTPGEVMMAIYANLALFYANELQKLNKILGCSLKTLNIVGGGSNISLLNQMTSTLSGLEVVAGPNEATAIGNVLVQMISTGEVKDIVAGRKLIKESFELKQYQPEANHYEGVLARYQSFLEHQDKELV
ncbi:rhamnulokinase [Lactiplantibacillus mudanjiangensis]|uniref:Rhamnulokinase n=1 Tax=Lactiplantibacillus mudanjiangensis TaxID=1296538 RepID=A0A660DUP2_9LACO|nr:rhamnulokinase [Lactiplantibacillus mudanjiangensis]VDG22546.1 rhamnulokinase [Lactobacillus pentosus] [Lactiplantibacillus mudanjiangensis]VDG26919.1 rhamnulokinase [Lactobacillus pentosus] [Lactiplantibacillus mudanjiangensis]